MHSKPDIPQPMELRQRILRRHAALRAERDRKLSEWKDLSELVNPNLGRFNSTDNSNQTPSRSRILDEHGTLELRTLSAGLMSGVTSPARPWFKLTLPNPSQEDQPGVREYLYAVQQIMERVFAKSNLYNSLHSLYEELPLFGTACLMVDEHLEDGIRCHAFTAGEYCISLSADKRADTLYRQFRMTVGQVVEQFGLDACSHNTRTLYEKGELDALVDILHAIEPNHARAVGSPFENGKPWRCVYLELGKNCDCPLYVGGYNEVPFMAPRWDVAGNDTYGSGPGSAALPTIKAIQALERKRAQGIANQVDPPLAVPTELRGQEINTLPGGITYLNTAKGIEGIVPLNRYQIDLSGISMDMQEKKRQISRAFYADLFLLISSDERSNITAAEIAARQQEKLIALGPVLERLGAELLNPLIDRAFAILSRQEMLPEPPEAIQGAELRVEFISILAQAQQASATIAIERTVSFIGNLAGLYPEALDKLDPDEAVNIYSRVLGSPATILRQEGAVAERRQQRQQQAVMQQQAQMGMVAVQGAKLLSETKTAPDGSTALQALLGT